MCGIVGAVSSRDIVPVLIDGLKRLEYRGYDSAGLAVLNGSLQRVRSTGRVRDLELAAKGLSSSIGIAHTRWATHGIPSERNAHPHISGGVSVVHNGIIENHESIRDGLKAIGYTFVSETDSEVIAHLIAEKRRKGADLFDAVKESVKDLRGAYAIAVLDESTPGKIVVARHGAPLLLGVGEKENFAASDAQALVQVTSRVIYLDDGDCACMDGTEITICDGSGKRVERAEQISSLSAAQVELGAYDHFMAKEMHEQPMAVANTLELVTSSESLVPELFGARAAEVFSQIESILILACGTSFHAGMVARYWLESVAKLPCNVEIASEFRYRESVVNARTLVVTISQSGETADTLAALQHARRLGLRESLTICNVPESSLIRASTLRFLTRAGPEIGVASTKAFSTQLAALVLLTMTIAKTRGQLSTGREAELLQALRHLPAAIGHVLEVEPQIQQWAKEFAPHRHALFLGRGVHWPIAMEGALKLKEISYIHAEAYAAGELKHGPLALVDEDMPVLAIAPNDALLEKLTSNLQEVSARGGKLFVIADRDAKFSTTTEANVIRLPDHAGMLSPILHTIPLQLLAYHVALIRGNDVDKPRNLAKSVTVE